MKKRYQTNTKAAAVAEAHNKTAAVGNLCKVAGIGDIWDGLSEAQQQAIIGTGGGALVGGGIGALLNKDNRLAGAGIGAGIGGVAGGIGGYATGDDAEAEAAAKMLEDYNFEEDFSDAQHVKQLEALLASAGVPIPEKPSFTPPDADRQYPEGLTPPTPPSSNLLLR